MRIPTWFFFLFLIACSGTLYGNTDSLRIKVQLARDDTTRIRLLTMIGDYYESNTPDSALFYYQQGLEVASASQITHIKVAEQQGLLLRYIGIIYRNKGEYATALDYYQKALDLFLDHDLKSGISAVYNNFGVVYRNLGNYSRAIEYYHKALAIFEETGNTRGVAFCHNNIGIIHDVQKEYGLALEYYLKAQAVFEQDNVPALVGSTQMNIGMVYLALKDPEQALVYCRLALENLLPNNRKVEASRTYTNMALAYAELQQYDNALENLEKGHQLALEIDDRKGMAAIFRHQAEILMQQGKLENSHQAALWALEVAELIDALDDKTLAYKTLLQVAEASGNLPLAYEYSRKYMALNDSLHNLEKSRVIFELEASYQNDKKQQEIELLNQRQEVQRLQLNESRAQLRLQRAFTLLVIILLVTGLTFLYLQIRQNKKIRLINERLAQKNHEIQKKNTEISRQRNEINTQRNIVLAQKNQIQQQNEALSQANMKILAGIRYAERIQSSLFPDEA
ncbi:MAG: tetratricopeptide repeat protein, partial [Bacteroidales bacterium]